MGTYGRNFAFRIPPDGDERHGRYRVPATGTKLPIGAPVLVDTTVATDSMGAATLKLAHGEQARPNYGQGGILVYEYGPAAFAGLDPFLYTYSDLDTVPLNAMVQVVRHPGIKVVFTNTANTPYVDFAVTFRSGPRVMVAGFGSTVAVQVGDYLTPYNGDDTTGYWQITTTAANGWLCVTNVDSGRGEVEAEIV